jgi:methyl-accepting chemotaxis protein
MPPGRPINERRKIDDMSAKVARIAEDASAARATAEALAEKVNRIDSAVQQTLDVVGKIQITHAHERGVLAVIGAIAGVIASALIQSFVDMFHRK